MFAVNAGHTSFEHITHDIANEWTFVEGPVATVHRGNKFVLLDSVIEIYSHAKRSKTEARDRAVEYVLLNLVVLKTLSYHGLCDWARLHSSKLTWAKLKREPSR